MTSNSKDLDPVSVKETKRHQKIFRMNKRKRLLAEEESSNVQIANYKCKKCTGDNIRGHGLYCPENKKEDEDEK